MNRAERQQYRTEVTAIQRRYETRYFNLVRKAIQLAVDKITSIVKQNGIQAGITAVNRGLTNPEVTDAVLELYIDVGTRFARRQWMAFNKERNQKSLTISFETKGFGFNATWAEFIKNYLYQFLIDKITFKVAETTRDILLTTLQTAIDKGWGVDETVKALDELPLSETQAARIVRTEITRAANVGAMAAGETFPFQQVKEWIAAKDTRTRGNPVTGQDDHANHWSLDGKVVDYEDTFVDPRNGDHLDHPGDPRASAASTINCRCSVAVYAKRDSNGDMIPKRKTTVVTYPSRRRRQIITI